MLEVSLAEERRWRGFFGGFFPASGILRERAPKMSGGGSACVCVNLLPPCRIGLEPGVRTIDRLTLERIQKLNLETQGLSGCITDFA